MISKEKQKEYYENNKERILKRVKERYEKNKEKIKEYRKEYYLEHKEKETERNRQYKKEWAKTCGGRITKLIENYKHTDKFYGLGETDLTKDYLLNILFPKGCCYCGEKDYMKLGCDRIDNNKPHTVSNCVCSCGRCNEIRQKRDFEEFFFEKYIESIQK